MISGSKVAFPSNPKFGSNLLANPGAETGDLTGWTILVNGGHGWIVREDKAHTAQYSFQTSFAWNRKYQIIDLLAEGFTEQELDAVHEVFISNWGSGFGHTAIQTLDWGHL